MTNSRQKKQSAFARRPLKHERWIIENWLFHTEDLQDLLQSLPLESHLLRVYHYYEQEDIDAAEREWLTIQDTNLLTDGSQRQLARYHFLGGQIASYLDHDLDAYTRFRLCKCEIPDEDWISQIQLGICLGAFETRLKHYREALATYTFLLDYQKRGPSIPFALGEWRSFFANALLQRAQVEHARGFCDDAQEDLHRAMDLVNIWIRQNSPAYAHRLPSDVVRKGLRLLSLDKIEPQALLESSQREVTSWLELYHWIPWQFALSLMWQYKIEPERYANRMWADAYKLVRATAKSCERFSKFSGYAAQMWGLSAEIALINCQHSELTKRRRWLFVAWRALTWAAALNITAPPTAVEEHLLAFTWESYLFWSSVEEFEERDNAAPMKALASAVTDHLLRSQTAQLKLIEGRCYFLLGKIYEYLDESSERARKCYTEALAIFADNRSMFYPLYEETRRALQDLEEEEDQQEER